MFKEQLPRKRIPICNKCKAPFYEKNMVFETSTEGPMCNLVRIGEAFQKRRHLKIMRFLHMYIAQGQGQITLEKKI